MFEAIEHNNILTLNKQYFRLRKPLERRLYELARKHCGQQPKWEIGIPKLQEKTGSLSNTKEFKRMLAKVITDNLTHNHMPDYTFELVDHKLVVRPIKKTLASTSLPSLKSDTYEEARYHAQGWDIRVLEAEWRDWVAAKNITVQHPDKNFISFCKQRGPWKNEELF
jgi:plasmid replication initiation protein